MIIIWEPADYDPNFWAIPKHLGFLGGIWVLLGGTWEFPKKILRNPNGPTHPNKSQVIPKKLDFFWDNPKSPPKKPKFWGEH